MSRWWEERICAFDTETTGVNVYQDEIAEAALVFAGGGLPRVELRWLFRTEKPIPPEATAIHGITNERVQREGRVITECLNEIASELQHHPGAIVIMNAHFDIRMFASNYERFLARYEGGREYADAVATFGERVVDPGVLDKRIVKYRKGKRRLSDLCAHYGVNLEQAHDCVADARAAGSLAYRMTQAHPEFFAKGTLADLRRAQFKWHRDQKTDLRAYFQRVGKDTSTFDNTDWVPVL